MESINQIYFVNKIALVYSVYTNNDLKLEVNKYMNLKHILNNKEPNKPITLPSISNICTLFGDMSSNNEHIMVNEGAKC